MSMTAVAQPSPSYSTGLPRNGWPNGSGSAINLNAMSSDDLQRMFVPRKNARRSNSSSSLSSNASTSSAASTSTMQPNGVSAPDSTWSNSAARKKPARGLWPSAKSEPVSGLSTARTQSAVAGNTSTAASGLSALHNPNSVLTSQHLLPSQTQQQNGMARGQPQSESPAVLHLAPMNGTFERKAITVPYGPTEVVKIGRQTNNKTYPTPSNGFFDSKVLSRQHAEIWAERDGKIWIRDVKSSNGTFVNGKRLSQENQQSDPHILKEGDLLELGIDIVSEDQKTVVHHKVAAKVELAGLYGMPNGALEMGFGDHFESAGGQLLPHSAQGFRRPVSQGSSVSSGRYQMQNNVHAAYHQKWLQPVTMEQIVRRLNTELRTAHIQSQDLRVTSNFVDAILTQSGVVPELPVKDVSPIKTSPTRGNDVKARFASEPPAPPPSQPLPEKPDIAARHKMFEVSGGHPQLVRSDTEKPKTLADNLVNGSIAKGDASSQIFNLVEALKKAEREISSQADRLREMESALQKEREARSSAEERAGLVTAGDVATQEPTVSAEETEGNLQSRLDAMRSTVDEMKFQMEDYRRRAESAEAESQRDRQTLAEMVDSIRRREEVAKRKRLSKKRNTSNSNNSPALSSTSQVAKRSDKSATTTSIDEEKEHTPIDDSFSDDELDVEVDSVLSKHLQASRPDLLTSSAFTNGTALSPLSDAQLKELSSLVAAAAESLRSGGHVLDANGSIVPSSLKKDASSPQGQTSGAVVSRRRERMVQSAPYVSIVGVVIIGVGMMAWLNGWQKPNES